MLLIGVAAVGPLLKLGARGAAWVTKGLLVCAWGNIIASWIGPLTETRGLSFTGIGWNSLVFLLFMAVGGVIGAMTSVWLGSRRGAG